MLVSTCEASERDLHAVHSWLTILWPITILTRRTPENLFENSDKEAKGDGQHLLMLAGRARLGSPARTCFWARTVVLDAIVQLIVRLLTDLSLCENS